MPPSSDSSSANQSTGDPETEATLECLPQPVAALIYSQLDAASRRALLQVSRWARDVVLREVRSISLQIVSTTPRKPILQLLRRTRTTGTIAQLSIAACNFNRKSKLYSYLFRPATQQAGWASVKALVLKDFPWRSTHTQLLSSVFPALQRLELVGLSLHHADLSNLVACSCLSSLKLSNCNVISLGPGSSSLLANISKPQAESPSQRLANISGLTQLQHLEYPAAGGSQGWFADGEVEQVCTTFTQLRSLALCGKVSQADFDVLLAHGTHFTHLKVG